MEYLPLCFDSLDRQTFKDFEVILVDDGSRDSSPSICDEYCRTHSCAKVLHKENQGPFLARADAVSLASGEYCICLDSDDALHFEALEAIDKAIELWMPDVVIFGVSRKPDFSTRWDRCGFDSGVLDSKKFRESIAAGNSSNLANKAIRTDFIRSSASAFAFEGFSYGEDWLQVAEIASRVSKTVFIDEPLYFYRENCNSTTSGYKRDNLRQILIVLEEMSRIVEPWGTRSRESLQDVAVVKIYEQMAAAMMRIADEDSLREEYRAIGKMIPEEIASMRKPMGMKNKIKNVAIDLLLRGRIECAKCLVKAISGNKHWGCA